MVCATRYRLMRVGRLVERSGHAGEPALAGEPDKPVPYLVLLDQHEDHKHDHEARAAQGLQNPRNLPDPSRL